MTQQPRSTSDPLQQARAAYAETEKAVSKAMEDLVSSQSFAESLALMTSNAVALSQMATTGLDQFVRMTRLASRNDITSLGRQLARTEDKLKQVLQVVEQLKTELEATRAERDEARATKPTVRPEGGRSRRSESSAGHMSSSSGKANGRTRAPRSASPAADVADSVAAAKGSTEGSR